jgi:HK97 family phage major capsid protein
MAAGVEISADLLSKFSIRDAILTAGKFPVRAGIPSRGSEPSGLSNCKWDPHYSPAKVVSDALRMATVSTELAGHFASTPDSLLLPLPHDLQRSTITQGNTGSQLVGNASQNLLDALRPSPLLESLGVLMPSGLSGGTAQLIGMDAAAPYAWYVDGAGPAAPGIGSTLGITLQARTLIAIVEISYQALHQTSDRAEAALLEDLLAGVRRGLEAAVFAGAGAPAPTGVINTAGINATTYAGTVPSRAELLGQLTDLAAADVDLSRVQFVVHPAMAVKLYSVTNAANQPIYDGTTMLGLPVRVSSNCPATKVIAADWRQVAVPIWGRVELARHGDVGGLRADGAERFRAMVLADVGVIRPLAISVGTATS